MWRRLERKVKVSCPAGVPWVSRGQKSQKRITRWLYYVIYKQRKDQILGIERGCISAGRTMGLGVFWKQVNYLKSEIERLKRQIKQLHVDCVECETGELDRADKEVVPQPDDNVLLQEFTTAGASGWVEDTRASGRASDITKWLQQLLKYPKNDLFHHCDLRMHSDWNRKQKKSPRQCPVLP